MSNSDDWLNHKIDRAQIERLESMPVALSASRSISLAAALCAWWEHVAKLEADLGSVADDRSVWGAHDFVAALVLRDCVAEGLDQLGQREVHIVESLASEIDEKFFEFTESDNDGCITRVDGRSTEGRNWWWSRVPARGPIHDELRRFYGHRARD